jgi:hypothetical protein
VTACDQLICQDIQGESVHDNGSGTPARNLPQNANTGGSRRVTTPPAANPISTC